MGSRYTTVEMRYHGSVICTLPNRPVVWYSSADGRKRLPMTGTEAQATVRVGPGETIQFSMGTVDGFGGYDPSDPACAHPKHYRRLLVGMPGGGRISLGSTEIDAICDGVVWLPWIRSQ